MKDYIYSEVYHGSEKGEKPSLSKPWFIFYSFNENFDRPEMPVRMRRIRIKAGLNRISDLATRMDTAKDMCRKMDRMLDEGYNPFDKSSSGQTSIDEAIRWALSQKRWSKETMSAHMSTVNVFKELMGKGIHKPVISFTKKDAKEMLNMMATDRKVGDKSWNRWRNALHGIFSEMVECDMIPSNPFAFRNKKLAKREKPELLDSADLSRIREYLLNGYPHIYTFYLMLNMTAIRPTELLRLKCDNIDTERWVVVVKPDDVKDREGRFVVIPEKLRPYLAPHLKQGHYLFGEACEPQLRDKPMKYSNMSKFWIRHIREKLGIKAKPYSLKHLGMRTMLKSGIPDKGVQYQAGHSTGSMTDLYTDKDATLYTKQLEKFEGNL